MKNPPIEDMDYLHGVKVVHIEDLRVSRGKTRRPVSSCKHQRLSYDDSERRIQCKDCEEDLEPFDAFKMMVERADAHQKYLEAEHQKLAEARRFSVRSIAAKVMDRAWRSTKSAPCCPHCKRVILPEDVKDGVAMVGKEFEIKRRTKESK